MAQNITLLGASYSDVPAVTLPKTGGGTAQFYDTTDADATAADITSGKTAYVNGVKLTGTSSGGGGGSSYTLVTSEEATINHTSTSEANILNIPFTRTTGSIIYVKIRDKAGKRNGYFYGSDNYIIDIVKANGTGSQSFVPKVLYAISNTGSFYGATSSGIYLANGGYGVYVKLLNDANGIRIYAKYGSAYGTINGTFTIDVYKLQWPGDVSPLS